MLYSPICNPLIFWLLSCTECPLKAMQAKPWLNENYFTMQCWKRCCRILCLVKKKIETEADRQQWNQRVESIRRRHWLLLFLFLRKLDKNHILPLKVLTWISLNQSYLTTPLQSKARFISVLWRVFSNRQHKISGLVGQNFAPQSWLSWLSCGAKLLHMTSNFAPNQLLW